MAMNLSLPQTLLQRRHILSIPPLLLLLPAHSSTDQASSSYTMTVNGGQSISEAISASPDNTTIVIMPGIYKERLVISKPITLIGGGGGVDSTSPPILSWTTNDHYEPTILITSPGVVVSGLNIMHSSPSIADNFAVKIDSGDVKLLNCIISSRTGTGIGIEALGSSNSNNSVLVKDCTIKGCNMNGIGVFGEGNEAVLQGNQIEGNLGDGILVGDGAAPIIERCRVLGNKKYGMRFRDCGGTIRDGNVVEKNGMGAVEFTLLRDEGLEEGLLALRRG